MAAPDVIDREITDLTVANTITETDIFTHSVAANSMGTTGMLMLNLVASLLDNATGVLTVRVKFGGTTIFQDDFVAFANSVDRHPIFMELWLANQGATNDQTGGGQINAGDPGGATTGIGNLSGVIEAGSSVVFADSAIDTTTAQTFAVTVQWSAADANLSFIRRCAVLTLF